MSQPRVLRPAILARTVLGIAAVLAGIMLIPLPVPLGLPGIGVGVALLAMDSAPLRRLLQDWRRRYPVASARIRVSAKLLPEGLRRIIDNTEPLHGPGEFMVQDVEILHRSTAYEGFLKLKRYQLRHTSFHGGWCEPVFRERIEGLAAVSVLPYDPVRDEVVLIEEFRIGALEQEPWLLEVVSGYRERDESPEDVARREAREEADLELGELMPVGSFYVSPGISSERIHLFCARVDSSGAGGVHGVPEEGEEIRVVTLPAEQAIGELFGRINSTGPLILMQWFAANRERLRGIWR